MHAISAHGMEEILKPLKREIHLFDTYIAGTSHVEDQTLFDALKAGDPLSLRREQNKYDERAIVILNAAKQKLGYVPEKDNLIFSRLMDAGKMLTARVRSVQKKRGFVQVDIGIYLVDF